MFSKGLVYISRIRHWSKYDLFKSTRFKIVQLSLHYFTSHFVVKEMFTIWALYLPAPISQRRAPITAREVPVTPTHYVHQQLRILFLLSSLLEVWLVLFEQAWTPRAEPGQASPLLSPLWSPGCRPHSQRFYSRCPRFCEPCSPAAWFAAAAGRWRTCGWIEVPQHAASPVVEIVGGKAGLSELQQQ